MRITFAVGRIVAGTSQIIVSRSGNVARSSRRQTLPRPEAGPGTIH